MLNTTQASNYESNKYFDTDSPIGRYKLCYPNKSANDCEKAVIKYKRRVYSRFVHGNTSLLSLSELKTKAAKVSYYSPTELDILVIYHIEQDFRDELAEMYTISMDIIETTPISDLHKLTKDFQTIEEAYGKRVKVSSENLKDPTLYKNKCNYWGFAPR
jgi:hypothetical protein